MERCHSVKVGGSVVWEHAVRLVDVGLGAVGLVDVGLGAVGLVGV